MRTIPNEDTALSGWLTLLSLSAITAVSWAAGQVVTPAICAVFGITVDTAPGYVVEGLTVALIGAAAIWPLVLRPVQRRTIAARAETRVREEMLRTDRNAQEFYGRLHRALEMSEAEQSAYDVARRAVDQLRPETASQLLLADSSEAHLKPAMDNTGPTTRAGCGVVAPHSCPAIRKGQTAVFATDTQLDACPWLAGRSEHEVTSAVCIPVSTVGRSIGVLHLPGSTEQLPSAERIAMLETVAEQVGTRIGTIRVTERTHLQAATDPLTGLLNRRSVENQAQAMVQRGQSFSLAMGDLDHFKDLNDTHGHDAGDRALRQFARVMRTVLRSEDIVSRYGGEEFVIVLPGLTGEQASSALRRVQEQLLVAVAGGTIPPFTVTFGVAQSDEAGSLEELVRLADGALFRGKRAGRNRIVVEDSLAETEPVAHE